MKKLTDSFKQFGYVIVDPVLYLAVVGIVLAISTVFSLFDNSVCATISSVLAASTNAAIIGNLAVILCVGITVGFAKKQKGNAAVFGLMAYLIFIYANNAYLNATDGLVEEGVMGLYGTGQAMALGVQVTDTNVFGGMLVGCLAAWIYNKTIDVKVPEYLRIYGGPRLALIVMIPVMILFSIAMCYVWPPVAVAINNASGFIQNAGGFGVFVYGFLNRFLIPTGLHHFMWMPFCFTPIGGTATVAGATYYGASNIFYAEMPLIANGTLTAVDSSIRFGAFGFAKEFLSLGTILAFIYCARPENKKAVSVMLVPMYITVALAGITEPLDFTILFASPWLWFAKSVMTGLGEMTLFLCGVKTYNINGFIELFLIDTPLPQSVTKMYLYIIIGLIFTALSFAVFTWMIKKFNFKTPGNYDGWAEENKSNIAVPSDLDSKNNALSNEAIEAIVEGVGGLDNIDTVGHCITRLRIALKDPALVNDEMLKNTSNKGIHKSGNQVQLIYGLNVVDVYEQFTQAVNIND